MRLKHVCLKDIVCCFLFKYWQELKYLRHEQGIKQTSSKMKDRKKEGTALLSCDFIVLDVVVIPAFVMHINLSYF